MNILGTGDIAEKLMEQKNYAVDPKLSKTLFFLIDTLSSKLFDSVSDLLKKYGITPRHFTILYLLESKSINQQDLADAIHVGRNAMVQLIDQLEELDLAQRRVNPINRREHHLVITAKGQKIFSQSQKGVKAIQDELLSKLNVKDQECLIKVINDLLH